MQGRIVDPLGVAVTNNPVNFDIKIYTPTTGVAGSHCLLFEETQSLDMTNSAGAFVLQIGTGTRVGAGPTLRETFTNASVASFGALTCGVGTSYTPGAIDDRSIEMTVSFGAQNLALSPIPVKAVPYAFQANQIGGYGINNLVRLNGIGSATNLDVDQFNYLTGFFNDNATQGNLTDDSLNAQSLQIKNLAAPTLATDAANKSYVDTAVAGVSAGLPALSSAKMWVGNSANVAVAVSMTGDAGIDNTGKLTVTGLQSKAVTLTGLAASDTLIYNGTAWVNKNVPTCSGSQYLTFNGTNYSCATPAGVSPTGSALTSAQIWVGNASNLAAPVAMTGDASISNTGVVTVSALQGKAVSATAPTANQVLTWNSTNTDWEATTPAAPGTTISGGTTKVLAMFNPAGTNVINSTITDNGATGVNFANSKITFGGTLFAHDSGTRNTFLGILSGNTTTSGSGNNSAVGYGTLTNNTTGSNNSVVGSSVLQSNTTGYSNSAVGYQALLQNTTGAGNSSVGSLTLQSNTTGSYNSAVGYWALVQNTIGGENSAVGLQALQSNTTGSNNSAVGAQALGYNTTGNNNTAMGTGTGGNADPASTGNLFLGYNAGPAGLGVINNKLYIHNAASDTPLIGGDFANGFVQINNQVELPLTSTTPTPTAGYGRVYAKADGNLYYKNATTEYQINGGAVSGVTSVTATAPLAVSASTGAITASMNLASGDIYVGNGSGKAADVAMSGDATISNTGALTLNTVPVTKGGTGVITYALGQVPVYDGTKLTGLGCSIGQVLQWDATNGFICATLSGISPVGSALLDGKIWMGNSANVAAAVGTSGDVSLSDAGVFKVTALQNVAVDATAPTTNQILAYNGSTWIPTTPSGTTITGGTTKVLSMFNATGDNVINSSITDNGATGVNFANSKIQFGGSLVMHMAGGVRNFWVGVNTGTSISTGTDNSALGTNSLWNNTTGSYNTASGSQALYSNTTGNYNTGLGLQALQNTDIGSSNMGVGSQALRANTSGNDNTAVGAGAIASVVTGSNNTGVGSRAGLNANGASSGNIFLGYSAGPSGVGLVNNKLYIHNSASNTPLIGGDFTNGYVQINNQVELPLTSTTPTPTAGYGRVYAKADGNLYYKNATTEYQIGGAGSGVTSIAATAPLAVSASTGAVTASLGLTSAHMYVGNASNLAADVAMSGDAAIDNTGKVTVNALQGKAVSATAPTANQILQYNGSAWIPTTSTSLSSTLASTHIFVGNASNVATDVAMSGDATIAADGTLTLNTVPVAKGGTGVTSYATGSVPVSNGAGALTATVCPLGQTLVSAGGTGFGCGLQSASGSSLAAGDIWVGNVSGIATAAAPSGDVTMTNAGAFTVTQLQGRAVAATAPTSNQVLQWNSTNTDWEPATASGSTISGGTTKVLPMFNATGDNVVNSSITDNGATGVNFANSMIAFGGSLVMHQTGGTSNVFLGTSAGNTTMTGTNNTAIGSNALQSNAAKGTITAIGVQSMMYADNTTTAGNAFNTAVGYQSLRGSATAANNTGTNNTAIGSEVLLPNTTGSNNTGTGNNALHGNSTGNYNTAAGSAALYFNLTGNSNIGNGYATLYNNTTGSYNTADGTYSLYGNATGSNNSALGYKAGYHATAASTGNVFLGYSAGPAADGAVSNKLYIHNAASDTPLIGGDFSAGYVQINNQIEIPLTSTTPTPTAGYGRVYAKADGNLYYKNATTESQINGTVTGSGTTGKISMFTGASAMGNSQLTDNGASGVDFANSKIQFNGSLFAHTTNGVSNAFVGVLAGSTANTGFSNTAMGGQALAAITSGSYNSAVGYGALQSNTTGHDNTSVGFATLPTNTTASFNTAVGSSVLNQSTGGSNTAVGYGALNSSTTASFQTAVGYNALQLNTTGTGNTAFGSSVLNGITTGTSNTGVGNGAGVNATGASSGNVFVGYSAGPTVAGAYSNTLYISNSQTDTPLIWGDFSNKRLGIGRQATTYQLEVSGQGAQTTGGTAWVSLSDRRLKNIEGDYEYGLDEILKLHTVRYHYKKDNPLGLDSVNGKMGVIAQEVMTVIPDAVHQRPDGYYDLNVDPIHWAMVNAVQQLNNKCEMSAHQIETIQQQIKDHDRRLASVESDTKDLRQLVEQQAQMIKQLQSEIRQIKGSSK